MSDHNNSGYLDMELLRFTTAGSVDDGKSTLIGRLLYDSKAIFEDQLQALERTSQRRGEEEVNLALLTDGLRAEREQGITIDVAYRYFSTPKRKFIIADTPGHIQYTRNMVTGASTANVAIILIDARNGISEQTKRHTFIASLLGIPHLAVCVNKMDLVDFDEKVFESIKAEYMSFAHLLQTQDISFIPISARDGDNVVDPSERCPWYTGTTLLNLLETIDITKDYDYNHPRFPVQYVVRPYDDQFHDFRGYAGKIAGGKFKVGDTLKVLSSGKTSQIDSILVGFDKVEEAATPQSATITLKDDIDISRGDMLVLDQHESLSSQEIDLMVCWFSEKPLQLNGKYIVKHTTNEVRAIVKKVDYKINISTLEQDDSNLQVNMNDIARISIKTTKPLFYDPYTENRNTGSLILIDEGTNVTVAGGMIL